MAKKRKKFIYCKICGKILGKKFFKKKENRYIGLCARCKAKGYSDIVIENRSGRIKCLRCGEIFQSKDIRNNRVCLSCKKQGDWEYSFLCRDDIWVRSTDK